MKRQKEKKPEAKRTKKIRKGDRILVIAGNDKGQSGTVLSFRTPSRVVVQGINIRKKHVRKSQQSPNGGIISIECPIHVSNVRLCTDENRPIKTSIRQDKDGSRHLVYRTEGSEEILYHTLKKGEAS